MKTAHFPPSESVWERMFTGRGSIPGPALSFWPRVRSRCQKLNLNQNIPDLASEVVRLAPGLNENESIALTLLIIALLMESQQGSTRMPLEAASLSLTFRALLTDEQVPENMPAATIHTWTEMALALTEDPRCEPVFGLDRNDYRPLIMKDGYLYQQRLLMSEHRLADNLAKRFQVQPKPTFDVSCRQAVLETLFRPLGDIVLSEEQRGAVEAALDGPLTLISGGPGTGKTSIVIALLRAFIHLGIRPDECILTAPTGKAAYRMGESIRRGLASLEMTSEQDCLLKEQCPTPSTIHRLLDYSPGRGRFRRHKEDPVRARVVIVDESSMVDALLMEHLVNALETDCRLILLGDKDQLPSVSAGAVFRDLGEALPHARVHLTRSFRMRADNPHGSNILRFAEKIRSGDVQPGEPQNESPPIMTEVDLPNVTLRGVENLHKGIRIVGQFLERWFHSEVPTGRINHLRHKWDVLDGSLVPEQIEAASTLFTAFGASRLLCVTRTMEMGVDRVNATLHAMHAKQLGRSADEPYFPYEPVMMLKNDYQRRLFNGDQGIIVPGRSDDQVGQWVLFPGLDGPRGFPLENLKNEIELCYAMTVHKSQGSEYDRVALLLPSEEIPLLTRELLYTAVTRCKAGVLLVGDPALLQFATDHPARRSSGLRDAIRITLEHQGGD